MRKLFQAFITKTTSFFQSMRPNASQQQPNGKKHPMDAFFKSFLSKSNLSAPPLDGPTAYKILNIEPKQKQIDPRFILERFHILYKKNDPLNGGTAYLQSKVFAAKQTLMTTIPNAAEIQKQFYKEVIEPELKAEQQKKQKEKEQQDKKKKDQQQQNKKKQTNDQQKS